MKFEDRVPTYPNRYEITRENGTTEYVLIRRADEATKEGTPLNADNLNGILKSRTPRNLLDNSCFRDRVNQRGYEIWSTYPEPLSGGVSTTCYGYGSGYTIDRWIKNSGVNVFDITSFISIEPNSEYTDREFYQKLVNASKLLGKTLTFAVGTNVGVFVTSATLPSKSTGSEWLSYGDKTTTFGEIAFRVSPGSSTEVWATITVNSEVFLYWAAVYEGEYTIDTLPDYQPKGFGVELVECQRYYQRHAMNIDTNERFVPITIPMRTTPKVEFNVVSGSGTPSATVSTPSLVTVSCGSGSVACEVMLSADL